MIRLIIVTLLVAQAAGAQGVAAEEAPIRVLVPGAAEHRLQSSTGKPAWHRVEVPGASSKEEALDLAHDLFGDGAILERVYHLEGPEDEPLFADQWFHENTGQSGGTIDADIDSPDAWKVSLGSGVLVAVVDSGINASHPDLAGQIAQGWDTVDEDNDPSPVGTGSSESHATVVAGLVVAAANGMGVAGVAPEAQVLNMRACSSGDCWSLDVAEAIYFAVDNGAQIINLSLGGPGKSDPPLEAAIGYARAKDVLVLAAAGNTGVNIDTLPGGEIMIPAGLPLSNIVSVGASDFHDARSSFSNYGVGVDLFAPGESLVSTGGMGGPEYVFASGSSFAAPLVSGAAALLLSQDPSIGHRELKARLEVFADKPAALAGLSANGRLNAGTTLTIRFADTSKSVFVNAIDWIEARGITEGCNPPFNFLYCPLGDVTRGEMAVFFARAFGLPLATNDHFIDDNGRFYEGAANRMFEAGVTLGCGGMNYCGERKITRGELAAMLARVLSLPQTQTDFFKDDDGTLFEGAINKIAKARITNGCNPPKNDRFCPTAAVSRGEMAAFLKRAVEHLSR